MPPISRVGYPGLEYTCAAGTGCRRWMGVVPGVSRSSMSWWCRPWWWPWTPFFWGGVTVLVAPEDEEVVVAGSNEPRWLTGEPEEEEEDLPRSERGRRKHVRFLEQMETRKVLYRVWALFSLKGERNKDLLLSGFEEGEGACK